MAIIFRELGNTGNYFQGPGEQAQSFGDLGSPAKKYKKTFQKFHLKGKASISLISKKKTFGFLGADSRRPLSNVNVFTFVLICSSALIL